MFIRDLSHCLKQFIDNEPEFKNIEEYENMQIIFGIPRTDGAWGESYPDKVLLNSKIFSNGFDYNDDKLLKVFFHELVHEDQRDRESWFEKLIRIILEFLGIKKKSKDLEYEDRPKEIEAHNEDEQILVRWHEWRKRC